MKTLSLIFAISGFASVSAFAQRTIDLTQLAGTYSAPACVQTQLSNSGSAPEQGYLNETYGFTAGGAFTYTREWHKVAGCGDAAFSIETTKGSVTFGNAVTGMFLAEGTFEADYSHDGTVEKGLLWVSQSYGTVKVARGFGPNRNTMLSYTEYSRSK